MILNKKVAVVTGVSRGIGRAIFYKFVSLGATVIGIYNRETADSQTLVNEAAANSDIMLIRGDVCDSDFIKSIVTEVLDRYGRIDILVNNAGINSDNITFNMTLNEWDKVFNVNFKGTANCIAGVVPTMKNAGRGSIVNLVSVTGVLGREAQTNYGASKGAIMGMTRLYSRIYAKDGIRFNSVAPGMIETQMIEHVPDVKLSNFLRFTHDKRLGQADEIADGVAFLVSDYSKYCTGIVLKMDGGFMR